MLASQRIQVKMSELRQKINGLSETREHQAEYDTGRTDLADLEKQYRTALEAESRETDTTFGGEGSSEHREALKVTHRADLGVLVGALISKRSLKSAAPKPKRKPPGDWVATTSPWRCWRNTG